MAGFSGLVYKEENENEFILSNDGGPYFQVASIVLSKPKKLKFSSTCLFYPESIKNDLLPSLEYSSLEFQILGGIIYSGEDEKESSVKSVLLQSKIKSQTYFVYNCFLNVIEAYSINGAKVPLSETELEDASIYFEKDEVKEIEDEEPDDEKEMDDELVRPNFETNKKKRIDNLGYSFEDDFIDEDEEEEEEIEEPIIVKREFTPASKSKPVNLNVNPNYRKTRGLHNLKKEETKPDIKTNFISNSNSKPKAIIDDALNIYSLYTYKKPKRNYNSKILIFTSSNEYIFYKQEFEKKIKSLNRINWTKFTGYCPCKPENGSPVYALASKFDSSKFNLLAACVDAYNNPISYLLSYKENPYICFILSSNNDASIVGFSSIGVVIDEPYTSFSRLLDITSPIKEARQEKKDDKEEVEIDDSIFEEEEAPLLKKRKRKPVRRVFILGRTLRKFEKLFGKSPSSRDDFDSTIETLLTFSRDELNAYFIAKDNKKIDCSSPLNIYKFQFGTKKDYEASRLFYCFHKDLERKLGDNDIIIIGFTNQDEHEDQRDEAELGSKYLLEKAELHQLFVKDEENASLDELPYLSVSQFGLLDKASSSLPIVFTGSAGTGKTLMSVAQYADLNEKNESILYLTYEPSLLNNVDKMFHSLGIANPNSFTFLSLASSILDLDLSSSYAGLSNFRDYFFSYLSTHKESKKIFESYKDDLDDLCLASYCFYNGVISGSRLLLDKKKSILTLDEFLGLVGKEEAFSIELKRKMYEIGKSYYEYLISKKLYSDGMIAKLLLAKEDKPIYENIIIDEYQDLSEICFASVLSLVKKQLPLRLYLFGDDNQTIQPTLFSFSSAEAIIRSYIPYKVKLKKVFLPSSYRSGPTLVNYVNTINKVKQSCIGRQNVEKDVNEKSSREDENDLFVSYIDKKSLFDDFVKASLSNNSDIAYIFPSLREKLIFIKHFSSIGLDKLVLEEITYIVEEAKGMEWDFVCLVRFLSSSRNSFDAMLENRYGKHSSFHRMLFNRLYVGLTRAKNKIVMFEDGVSPLVYSSLLSIPKCISSKAELEGLFETSSSFSSWIEYAKRLFKARQYQQAYLSLCRARQVCSKEDLYVAEAYSNYEKEFNNSRFVNANKYIDLFIDRNDLVMLKDAYKRIGNKKKLYLLDLCLKEDSDEEELVFNFSKNVELCSYMEKAFYFDRAASILNRNIKSKMERIVKNGKRR